MKKLAGAPDGLTLVLLVVVMAEMTEEKSHAWAIVRTVMSARGRGSSSATTNKAGGVNYGAIEWSEELQLAAIKEFSAGATTWAAAIPRAG